MQVVWWESVVSVGQLVVVAVRWGSCCLGLGALGALGLCLVLALGFGFALALGCPGFWVALLGLCLGYMLSSHAEHIPFLETAMLALVAQALACFSVFLKFCLRQNCNIILVDILGSTSNSTL